MNVGQLKKYLEKYDDETLVLVSSHDHSYSHANAYEWNVVPESKKKIPETFYDPDVDESGIPVIIIE
jgi:hypothetical protein